MGSMLAEIIQGRKTFFIAPDRSLMPLSYLEDYLSLGYECYFIDNDIFLPLEKKIELTLSVFKDSILFFNIDFPLINSNWLRLIINLKQKHPEASFGVLYNKRQTQNERANLEHTYLYTLGLPCGCIQLEYQKRNNFGIIEKTLYANQAMGRRKNVRAVCRSSCTFILNSERSGVIKGRVNDISLSHFSFTLPQGELEIKNYEKIDDINFTIRGTHFRSSATMYMKRTTELGDLFVFAFVQSNGAGGLDLLNRQILVPKIYEIMSENCHELLAKLFNAANHENNNDEEIAEIINAANRIDRPVKEEPKVSDTDFFEGDK